MSQNYQYNTIEEALRDLKEGKIVRSQMIRTEKMREI